MLQSRSSLTRNWLTALAPTICRGRLLYCAYQSIKGSGSGGTFSAGDEGWEPSGCVWMLYSGPVCGGCVQVALIWHSVTS